MLLSLCHEKKGSSLQKLIIYNMLKKYFLFSILSFFTLHLQAQADLVITEISYNPPESGSDSLEYVEVYNNGSATINLDGYTFSNGFVFTFPNINLLADEFVVVAVDSLAMVSTFGYIGAYEFTSGGLLNGGEAITIKDNNSLLVDSLTYNNAAPWPTSPDGGGTSLVLCDPSVDNTDGANWSASTFSTGITINSSLLFGSPGGIDSACLCTVLSTITPSACETYTVPSGDETYTVSGSYSDTLLTAQGCDSIITINLTINTNSTATITELFCSAGASYTVPSGDETYTISGSYSDTIPTVSGCDSVITINLTFGAETTNSITESVCNSYTVPSGAFTYTNSGTYNDTLQNATGCDSVITITLTVIGETSSTLNITECASYSVPSGDEIYTASGTYSDTIANTIGCDSIITINLTINNTTGSISPVVCDTYTVPSGDETYITSGTYSDTLPNANGCDSIISINLTVNTFTTTNVTEIICGSGLSYTVPSGDETYSTDGVFNDTLSTVAGCDSILIIDLSFSTESFDTITEVVCYMYTVPSGNQTYTISGTYNDTIANVSGCDSVITINLTVNGSTFNSITETACDSYTVPSGNQTYTVSGIYNDTLVNSFGCDSILTVNLTILESTTNSISETVCDTYTVPSGDETYTVSGVYSDTLVNAVGCDSVIEINLTVNNSTITSITEILCGTGLTYTVPSGDESYTVSGIYSDTLNTVVGCDSVITINLTISDETTSTIDRVACYTYTVPSGDSTYTTSGVYNDTISNVLGCDSVITINLTINGTTFSTRSETVCDAYTVPSGSAVYTSSGVYSDTIPNVNGCDSVITINLTVLSSTLAAVIDTTVCYTYTVPSGDETLTSSGTYSDTLTNTVGCDSIFTINLTVLGSTFETIDVTVCDTYTVPSGDETYIVSGMYMDTIANHLGCDSVITINLTVNNSTTITFNENICGTSYTVPSGDETYTTSGVYFDTIANSFGCDLVITINLELFLPAATTVTEIACDSFVSNSGSVYTTSGSYTETLTTINGCDSVVTIDLTILTLDNSVSVVDVITLSANTAGGVTYRWLDCDNNFSEISGETNQIFTASTNGNYAVEIDNGTCVDTSACFLISSVSVLESSFDLIDIFPNPSTGIVNIAFEELSNVRVNVYDVNGKLVYATDKLSNSNHTFKLESAPGLYFVEVTNDHQQKQQFKLIIE